MRRCNHEIFEKGEPVAALVAQSIAAEKWVKAVAKKAKAKVDWHYSGGIAQVLHLGDEASLQRVEAAIKELKSTLKGKIIKTYHKGESGLYRKGVTQTPKGAIAGFMDPISGQQVYVVKKE